MILASDSRSEQAKPPHPAYVLTDHAQAQIEEREISLSQLESVLAEPGQVIPERKDRTAYQSIVTGEDGTERLFRAIVEEGTPLVIVTVYLTSKVQKYWSSS